MLSDHEYILVTGTNSGVGFGIAHRLCHEFLSTRPPHHRLTLVMTTRSTAKFADTVKRLKWRLARSKWRREDLARLTLASAIVDLADMCAVAALARRLKSTYPKLDVLILNAGMGVFLGIDWLAAVVLMITDFILAVTCPTYKLQLPGSLTPDGLGAVFAANVFGHYYLVHELLGLLRKGRGRVLWQSSVEALEWAFDPADLQGIAATHSYESSKRLIDVLALTSTRPYARPWFRTEETGEVEEGVRCYLVHPGVCATNFFPLHPWLRWAQALGMCIARWAGSPWHVLDCYSGALSAVWLAFAEQQELKERRATEKKLGSGCDRRGREILRETDVAGMGSERWDSVARQAWEGMEELRRAWKEKLG